MRQVGAAVNDFPTLGKRCGNHRLLTECQTVGMLKVTGHRIPINHLLMELETKSKDILKVIHEFLM